jgi:hypothetical protein
VERWRLLVYIDVLGRTNVEGQRGACSADSREMYDDPMVLVSSDTRCFRERQEVAVSIAVMALMK